MKAVSRRTTMIPDTLSYLPSYVHGFLLPCDHGLDYLHQVMREINAGTRKHSALLILAEWSSQITRLYSSYGPAQMNEFEICCGRYHGVCVEDGGRGICSSSGCALKLITAAQIQSTHAARSPRAREVTCSVVCGNEVDIAARVGT